MLRGLFGIPSVLVPLLLSGLLVSATLTLALADDNANPPRFPAAPKLPAGSHPGARIQRTMKLLADSTPEHRNTVRILFYGQSITEQAWWRAVEADLRKRFPHADLIVENRAIGGFASQLLQHTAVHDLYPFYPDLLIFHVYGGNNEYEKIIAAVRATTTAEVLMQADHLTEWPQRDVKPEDNKGLWWSELMNNVLLPEIAKKHGCAFVDVRSAWFRYLQDNKLEPKDLLRDGVHLNEQGEYLMSEIIKQYLVRDPAEPAGVEVSAVTTIEVGAKAPGALEWADGKLKLSFVGNRVDAILAPPREGTNGKARVEIDGKKPSETAGLCYFTRPSPTQAGFWPGITEVGSEARLVPEKWTAKLIDASDDAKTFDFDVSGSVTGPDGRGKSSEKFVSNSRRVVIEPECWHLATTRAFTQKTVPPNFAVTWEAKPLYLDELVSAKPADPAREEVRTLCQGLVNDQRTHTLLLTVEPEAATSQPPAIKALRVYLPQAAR